jgi:hypothetical protein
MNAGDVLYIRGHGAAGTDYLESSDHKVKLTLTQLVSLLEGKLSTDFAGSIKIYACHSATDWGFSIFKWECFAQQFADAMWRKGYKKCRFFGYDDKVTTFSLETTETFEGTKVTEGGGHKYAVSGKRASRVRKEFTPRKT